jgi:DDE superfamily endonuclease
MALENDGDRALENDGGRCIANRYTQQQTFAQRRHSHRSVWRMLLDERRVTELGLGYVGVFALKHKIMSETFSKEVFHWHYGSSPLVVARMWFDLQQGEFPRASLSPKDNSLIGFKLFMTAIFFLWAYPRNAGLTASRFHQCIRNCKGEPLWRWIRKIEALKQKKIKWDRSLGDPNKSTFVGTIDDTDCRMWEKRAHHNMNIDKSFYSQKLNHAGLKYELIMHLTKPRCMAIVGPNKCAKHDMDVFRQETKQEMKTSMPPGKMLIADSIFKPGKKPEHQDEIGMFALPSSADPDELRRFKSRARARHESFNGRLKHFAFLRDGYRGVDIDKHGSAFKAICVIVQYQMDNGSPIFAIN